MLFKVRVLAFLNPDAQPQALALRLLQVHLLIQTLNKGCSRLNPKEKGVKKTPASKPVNHVLERQRQKAHSS